MDDDTYRQELEAILTNPHPTGIDPDDPYGRAEDGIDRYDGYGRDVIVGHLTLTDGEHGTELVVAYTHDLPSSPPLRGRPSGGFVHLPFDPEWRDLSGYAEPATYAPSVASKVMSAARQQWERHGPGRDWAAEREQMRAALPDRAAQQRMLWEALDGVGSAEEVSPGRFEVQLPDPYTGHPGQILTVLVTPDQWEEVLAWQAGADYDLYLSELVACGEPDESFIVFYEGDLVRSTREQLPPVHGRAIARYMTRQLTRRPITDAGWYAHPPEHHT
ncbi:hypothetical protein [Nocardioides insulae]|uniref:hypothetical protein n=1 Tax=Nocardioides insulae TaxID=394734 RepID=UPI00041B701D|nr:hypothetical protein [Nocardioides insulae]